MQTRPTSIIVLLIAACFVSVAAHAEEEHNHPIYEPPASFEPFLQLDGTWTGTATHANGTVEDTTAIYRTTAAGSAVAETIFVDTPNEMVTMFFAEGDTPMLTHYCGLANQPTMAGKFDAEAKTVTYTYTDGTNIADDNMPHMHSVVFKFLDDDHIEATWTLHAQGEAAGDVVLDLRRQAKDMTASVESH